MGGRPPKCTFASRAAPYLEPGLALLHTDASLYISTLTVLLCVCVYVWGGGGVGAGYTEYEFNNHYDEIKAAMHYKTVFDNLEIYRLSLLTPH